MNDSSNSTSAPPSNLYYYKDKPLQHFYNNDYSKEELVAEMASAFLCAIAGIDNTLENSTAYIKGWLRKLKDNKDCVICAGSKARKASDYIQGIDITKG